MAMLNDVDGKSALHGSRFTAIHPVITWRSSGAEAEWASRDEQRDSALRYRAAS